MLDRITPVILTRDEEPNIERCLAQLAWATDIVVVDSYSTDATVAIARRFANTRVFQRQIDSLAGQSNFGVEQVRTPWVLLLDADYMVTAALAEELRALVPTPGVVAYRGVFIYAVNGHPLRASLYPPRIVLMDREHSTIWQDGHTPRVRAEGNVSQLFSPIIHDDRKSFRNFVLRQRRYMRQEAEKLRAGGAHPSRLSDRVRRLLVVAPFAVVLYVLVVKGLVFEGRAGLRYAAERFLAEAILSWELIARLASRGRSRARARP